MTQIANLKSRGLTGTHLVGVFLKRQVQPLQGREYLMCTYQGAQDEHRLRSEELSSNKLETCLRNIIKVKDDKAIELTPMVLPFSAQNPPTLVRHIP